MRCVITADIIDSRQIKNPEEWLNHLRKTLNIYGKSPRDWEIYRGDSFQLEVDPHLALKAALHIKSQLKYTSDIEVRTSIGLGTVDFKADAVTRHNGSAYVNSGRAFDQLLSKKKKMVFKSDNEELDLDINVVLTLTEALLSSWTIASAQILAMLIQNPNISQHQLSEKLGITQPSVSARLRVAHAEEIMAALTYFVTRLKRAT